MSTQLKVVLVGLPGSGKTTFGRQLANELAFPFLDLDHLIEERYQLKISEIFSIHGEGKFREWETLVLQDTLKQDSAFILASGGGAPCFNDNMDFIKANGVSVFLNVDVNDLATRLYKAQGNNRPLLDKSQSEDVVIASIKKTFKERLSFYQQADIQVDGEITVSQLLWLLDQYIPV